MRASPSKIGYTTAIDPSFAFAVFSNNDGDWRLATLAVLLQAINDSIDFHPLLSDNFTPVVGSIQTQIAVPNININSRVCVYPPVGSEDANTFFQSIWVKQIIPSVGTIPGLIILGHPITAISFAGTYEIRL